jgi:hypothetical protein
LLITRTIPKLRAGVREKAPDEPFDIATLYNNIYYFAVDDRVALLGHIRFLGPGERDAAWSRLRRRGRCRVGSAGRVVNAPESPCSSDGLLPETIREQYSTFGD